MCEVASGSDGDEFLAVLDRPATQRGVAHLDAMLARHAAGEPLQYVLGRWGFRHLDLMVDRRVLIPRPETELVVEVALRLARLAAAPARVRRSRHGQRGDRAVARCRAADRRCHRVDDRRSPDALDVARANAAGIGRAAANVRIVHGDWFDALPRGARAARSRWSCRTRRTSATTIPTSNRSCATGSRSTRCSPAPTVSTRSAHRRRRARVGCGRADGWCWRSARPRAERCSELLRAAGYDDVEITPDLAGRDRVASGRISR